ncbi:MAG: XdhC family protein [Burkholderiaceae bacterium]
MESLDLRVLEDVLAWRRAGHAVTLVTVVETWGSAPRPPGALLAVRDDGRVSGSVSGGCIEDDLIARTKAAFQVNIASNPQKTPSNRPLAGVFIDNKAIKSIAKPSMIAYGVTKDEAARFGLPCGGTLRLVQEPVHELAWIEQVLAQTTAHQLVARTLSLSSGLVTLANASRDQAMAFDGLTLTTLFGPKWRLLLIGAGQLSQAVAQMAALLDFEVLVCDPREEYAFDIAHAGAASITRLAGMPDDVVREMQPDAHTAIVALTHDAKLDDMALMEALQSDAFYVGALGSQRNQTTRKQRMAEHFGLTEAELARLHGPVGLRIHAKTPAEIAVSIIAQIIEVKNTLATSAACADTVATKSAIAA